MMVLFEEIVGQGFEIVYNRAFITFSDERIHIFVRISPRCALK